jgi:hypothetical protein
MKISFCQEKFFQKFQILLCRVTIESPAGDSENRQNGGAFSPIVSERGAVALLSNSKYQNFMLK